MVRGAYVGMVVDELIRKVIGKVATEEKKRENSTTRKTRLAKGKVVTKWRVYTSHERSAIVKKLDACSATLSKVVKEDNRVEGFEHFGRSTLKWT